MYQQPCVLEEDLNVNFVCGPMVLQKAAYEEKSVDLEIIFFFFKKKHNSSAKDVGV